MAECLKCGHPNVNRGGHYMPWPDPTWLRMANPPRCAECGCSLLLADHHWEAKELKQLLCYTCYTRLKAEAEQEGAE